MEQIGKYRVERLLGRGGFAAVWLCHDPDLDRRVAIKVLADIYALDADIRRRFIQEARLLSRLDDERILRVHTIDTMEDGRPYFVADYADRGTLRDRMNRWSENGPAPASAAVAIAERIGECLAVAHHHNVVHRDLKPTNVLYRSLPEHRREDLDEALVLADFGIARALEGASRMGMLTTAAGTVPYMAPEQAQGFADTRCDLYAATVIFYEMLAGRPPFQGETDLAVLLKKQNLEFSPVTSFRPGLSSQFDSLIARGLAPDRDDRFGDASELLEELQSLPIPEVETPPPRPAPDPIQDETSHPSADAPPTTPHTAHVVAASPTDLSSTPPERAPSDETPEEKRSTPSPSEEAQRRDQEESPPPLDRPSDEDLSSTEKTGGDGPRLTPTRLLGTAAALALGIIAVVVVVSNGSDGAQPTQTSTAATPTTIAATTQPPSETTSAEPTPDEAPSADLIPAQQDIVSAFEVASDDTCDPVATVEGALFSVTCRDDDAGVTVTYSNWESAADVDAGVAPHVEDGGSEPTRWSLAGVEMGSRVAYAVPDGPATLFWTYDGDDREVLSGEAIRPDGDLGALEAWWREAGRIPTEPAQLTEEEQQLLAILEFGEEAGCVAVRRIPVEAAAAQLRCSIEEGGVRFDITEALLWPSVTDLQAYMEAVPGGDRLPWPDEPSPRIGERVIRPGGDARPATLTWSDDTVFNYTVQATTDGSIPQLVEWWRSIRR